MRMINGIFLTVVILCTLSSSSPVKAQGETDTVSATIQITATAINRFLDAQYAAGGIPQSESVTYDGVNYTVKLSLPQIILTTGNAKLQMIFDVHQGNTSLYHAVVDPSIDIPANQINLVQIQAFLTNLPTLLSNAVGLPTWLDSPIIQYWNSLGYDMYPKELVDTVNSVYLAQHGINVVSPFFALGWNVGQGYLDLVVTTYVNGQPPSFFAEAFEDPSSHHIYFKWGSSIQDTLAELDVWNSTGETELLSTNPDIVCQKDSIAEFDISDAVNGQSSVVVNAIFSTGETWYGMRWDNLGVFEYSSFKYPSRTEN